MNDKIIDKIDANDDDLRSAIKIVIANGFFVSTRNQSGNLNTSNDVEKVDHSEVRAFFDSLIITSSNGSTREMTRDEIANSIGRTTSLISTVGSSKIDGDRWSRAIFETYRVVIERERANIENLENLING